MSEDERGYKSQVDENLRRVFEKTLSEELPDRFKSLLDQLRDSDGKDGASASDQKK